MKRKIIHAVTLILGLSLFSFYAKAQNWQAYKGIWLKGYDNAPQAPLPPTGYSALTYFADSLGTYVYDWDSLAWLRIPGSGGAAGLTTADNGLIIDPAGNVRLGTNITPGILSSDVQINGAGNSISFGQPSSRLASFNVEGNGAHNILTTNGSYAVQLSTNTFGVASLFSTDFGSGDTGQATVDSDEIEISLSAGGNESSLTFQPTAITHTLTNNATFSNSITLTPTVFSAQVPSGGITFTPGPPNRTIITNSLPGAAQNVQLELQHNNAGIEEMRFSSSDGSGIRLNLASTTTPTITTANQTLVVTKTSLDGAINVVTQGGATGTAGTGSISLTTGAVTSGTGAVGDINILTGSQGGSGNRGNITIRSQGGGNIYLDALSGFIRLDPASLPTVDPCGTAPTGTLWRNANVLNICP